MKSAESDFWRQEYVRRQLDPYGYQQWLETGRWPEHPRPRVTHMDDVLYALASWPMLLAVAALLIIIAATS